MGLVVNPITPFILARTLLFQVGILGIGVLFAYLWLLPRLAAKQGMHPITDDERFSIMHSPLRLIFAKAKRWYDHMWWSLASTAVKTAALFLIGLTLFILLTDVGWVDAWNQWVVPTWYSYCVDPIGGNITGGCTVYNGWEMFLVMARASGTPNGAHLLSYIPLPMLGIYTAIKFRKTSMGNTSLGDVYLGVLVVALGVAIHEGIWMVAYFVHYYPMPGFLSYGNVLEDLGFFTMCILFLVAYWRYKGQKVPLWDFLPVAYLYSCFILLWLWFGLSVTTINNYAIGQGPFEVTQWWADPTVNAVEIFGWVFVAVLMGVVIWRRKLSS